MVVIAIFTKGTSPSVGWVAGGECYEEEVVCYSLVLEGCLVAVFVYVDTTARFSLLPRFSIGAVELCQTGVLIEDRTPPTGRDLID